MKNPIDSLRPDELGQLLAYGFDPDSFRALAQQLCDGTLPPIAVSGTVRPPKDTDFTVLPEMTSPEWMDLYRYGGKAVLGGNLAIIIMAGGAATRFGCDVKGLVEPLPGRSFIELKLRAAMRIARELKGKIPVAIMTSFVTDVALRRFLNGNKYFGMDPDDVLCFTQGAAPRLNPDGTLYRDEAGAISMHPPGHGNLLSSCQNKGVVKWLQNKGCAGVLISNVDNLVASPAPALAGLFFASKVDMMVELAPVTDGDPGGCPLWVNNHLRIVERFAFPEDFDATVLTAQNSNTLWLTTAALARPYPLTRYPAKKSLAGVPVVQFEQLVGQVSWFVKRCEYVNVGRGRFMPMKTPAHMELWRPVLKDRFSWLCE